MGRMSLHTRQLSKLGATFSKVCCTIKVSTVAKLLLHHHHHWVTCSLVAAEVACHHLLPWLTPDLCMFLAVHSWEVSPLTLQFKHFFICHLLIFCVSVRKPIFISAISEWMMFLEIHKGWVFCVSGWLGWMQLCDKQKYIRGWQRMKGFFWVKHFPNQSWLLCAGK